MEWSTIRGGGRFDALIALLDPEVVLRAKAAQLAEVNGSARTVWCHDGQPRVVFAYTITKGKIVAIEPLSDPQRLNQLPLTYPDPA